MYSTQLVLVGTVTGGLAYNRMQHFWNSLAAQRAQERLLEASSEDCGVLNNNFLIENMSILLYHHYMCLSTNFSMSRRTDLEQPENRPWRHAWPGLVLVLVLVPEPEPGPAGGVA